MMMSIQRVIGLGFMFLILLSVFVAAEDSCLGFFGRVSCILWGDPSLRANIAGEAFGSAGNLVGGAYGSCNDLSNSNLKSFCKTQDDTPKTHLLYLADMYGENVAKGIYDKENNGGNVFFKDKKGDYYYMDSSGHSSKQGFSNNQEQAYNDLKGGVIDQTQFNQKVGQLQLKADINKIYDSSDVPSQFRKSGSTLGAQADAEKWKKVTESDVPSEQRENLYKKGKVETDIQSSGEKHYISEFEIKGNSVVKTDKYASAFGFKTDQAFVEFADKVKSVPGSYKDLAVQYIIWKDANNDGKTQIDVDSWLKSREPKPAAPSVSPAPIAASGSDPQKILDASKPEGASFVETDSQKHIGYYVKGEEVYAVVGGKWVKTDSLVYQNGNVISAASAAKSQEGSGKVAVSQGETNVKKTVVKGITGKKVKSKPAAKKEDKIEETTTESAIPIKESTGFTHNEKGEVLKDGTKVEGVIYDAKSDSYRVTTGYIWKFNSDDNLDVQREPKGDYVIIEDKSNKLVVFQKQSDNSGYKLYEDGNAKGNVVSDINKQVHDAIVAGTYVSAGNNEKIVDTQREVVLKEYVGDELSKKYGKSIDWDKRNGELVSSEGDQVFELKTINGKIVVDSKLNSMNEVKVTIKDAKGEDDKSKSSIVIVQSGTTVLSASLADKEKGLAQVEGFKGGVFVGKDNFDDKVKDVTDGKAVTVFDSEEAMKANKPRGDFKADEKQRVATDYIDESQFVVKKNGEITKLTGDYYKKGETGFLGSSDKKCNDDNGCFKPSKGEIYEKVTVKDDKGKEVQVDKLKYLADYDTEGLGAGQKLERVELYDPKTGRYVGAEDRDVSGNLKWRVVNNQKGYVYVTNDKGQTSSLLEENDDQGIKDWLNNGRNTVKSVGQLEVELGSDSPKLKSIGDSFIVKVSEGTLQTQVDYSYNGKPVSCEKGNCYYVTYEANPTFDRTKPTASDTHIIVRGEQLSSNEVANVVARSGDKANELDRALHPDAKESSLNEEDVKKAQEVATDSSGATNLKNAQKSLESIYAIENSIKSYPALSQLIFGSNGTVANWRNNADRTFAPMLGTNWFPSAICEGHYDIQPAGSAVIKTSTGTYQAVAHVEGEISDTKTPLLCYRNPDKEAKEKFVCDSGEVCGSDELCYADTNEDGEADSDKPLQGFFYKITWSVTAPRDEKLTPFIDENGVAVKFNVGVDEVADGEVASGAAFKPFYSINGNTIGPIELKNGQSDKDVVTHYSDKEFKEVCIKWAAAPLTVPTPGIAAVGSFGLSSVGGLTNSVETVPNVCFTLTKSSVGKVSWEQSGKSEGTTSTVSNGRVARTSW